MRIPAYIALILGMALAACSPAAAPTIDASEVQAIAEGIAATSMALTVEAIPPTPVPTDTPQPTPTSFPTPDLSLIPTLASPTAASQSAQGDCLHPLDMGAAGPGHKTLVKNHQELDPHGGPAVRELVCICLGQRQGRRLQDNGIVLCAACAI
jgi:hypothetical protein